MHLHHARESLERVGAGRVDALRGARVAAVAILLWATNYPARFYWNGGAFLRMDWLFFLVAGISCLKKNRPGLGGFALGLATLLRIFPGAVLLAVLMISAELPRNAGLFAPIEIELPEGTLVNPCFPAATVFGNQMVDHAFDAIMQALAQIVPERATAGWCWELAGAWAGRRPEDGTPYVELGFFQEHGGGGATAEVDGYDAIGFVGCAGTLPAQDPEILELSGEQVCEEGCLSVPGIYEKVARSERVTVRALDAQGKPFEMEAGGLLAVCIQHEIDHLDGKVFVEHLSQLKQGRIKAKLAKQARITA